MNKQCNKPRQLIWRQAVSSVKHNRKRGDTCAAALESDCSTSLRLHSRLVWTWNISRCCPPSPFTLPPPPLTTNKTDNKSDLPRRLCLFSSQGAGAGQLRPLEEAVLLPLQDECQRRDGGPGPLCVSSVCQKGSASLTLAIATPAVCMVFFWPSVRDRVQSRAGRSIKFDWILECLVTDDGFCQESCFVEMCHLGSRTSMWAPHDVTATTTQWKKESNSMVVKIKELIRVRKSWRNTGTLVLQSNPWRAIWTQ